MQKGNTLIFLLIGIVVLTVAGGAYYLGRQTTPKTSSNPVVISQTPQPILTSSSSDETASWVTYTNSENGFSVKYPTSWVASTGATVPTESFEVIFANEELLESLDSNDLKRIKYSIEVWVDKGKTLENVIQENDTFETRVGYKKDKIMFNDLPAYKIINTGFDFPRDRVVVAKNNKVYSISVNYLLNEDISRQEAQKIYNLVLSTFKFID